MIKKAYNKIFGPKRQEKSHSLGITRSGCSNDSFHNFLTLRGHHNLAAHQAINYYSQVQPLATAINKKAGEAASLRPLLFNDEKNQFTLTHPLLTFLKRPNKDCTWTEFFFQLSAFFSITANVYIWASSRSGKPDSELFELFVIHPQNVSHNSDGNGNVLSMTLTNSRVNGGTTFRPEETTKLGLRFYDDMGNELWQIKGFSPISGSVVGQSRLTPLFYEIEQHIEASKHNLSLLENGMRPTMMLIPQDDMTPDQLNLLVEQLDKFQIGSGNTGRPLLMAGIKEAIDSMKSNRDMDFAVLNKSTVNKIYTALDIPLALISEDSMTLDNLRVANSMLYDMAAIPLANRGFEELSIMILHRYPGLEGSRLTFNEKDIPALRHRQLEQAMKLRGIGAHTDNEIRSTLGDEPLNGGDVVRGPINQIAIGQDTFTDDQPKPPKKRFMAAMEEYGMADDEIQDIANKAGL